MTAQQQQGETPATEAWAHINQDVCMACHAFGEDKRTLTIACLYDVQEVVPFHRLEDGSFAARICKHCRAEFLQHLSVWWAEAAARRGLAKDSDGAPDDWEPGVDIPIRELGTTRFITEAEWHERRQQRNKAREEHE